MKTIFLYEPFLNLFSDWMTIFILDLLANKRNETPSITGEQIYKMGSHNYYNLYETGSSTNNGKN